MADKKEVYVTDSGGGTGLGLIAGIVLAAIALFAVLFFLGVFDGKQGADVTIEAPKIDAPKVDAPKAD
jgi:hypothetical protein